MSPVSFVRHEVIYVLRLNHERSRQAPTERVRCSNYCRRACDIRTPSRIRARVFKEQTLPMALIALMFERVVEAGTERMKATS